MCIRRFFGRRLSRQGRLLTNRHRIAYGRYLVTRHLPKGYCRLHISFFRPLLRAVFFRFSPISNGHKNVCSVTTNFCVPPLRVRRCLQVFRRPTFQARSGQRAYLRRVHSHYAVWGGQAVFPSGSNGFYLYRFTFLAYDFISFCLWWCHELFLHRTWRCRALSRGGGGIEVCRRERGVDYAKSQQCTI